MNLTSKHLLVQVTLLLVLAISLVFTSPEMQTHAQSCVQPQLMHGDFVFWDSWPKGTNVTVRIDDAWSPTERGFFEQGIKKWNGVPPPNCSLVTFSGFSAHNFTNYSASPPDNTMDWMSTAPTTTFNGQVNYHYIDEVDFKIRAVRVWIRPGIPNVAENSYFVYLGTHETGHTFDLNDCLSTNGCLTNGLSIMGGHSSTNPAFNTGGPTRCDHDAVNKVYCPTPSPSPSPSPTPPQTESECQSWGWQWDSFARSCSPGGFVVPCPDTCISDMFAEAGQGGNSCLGDPTDFCTYPFGGCPAGSSNSGGGCCCSTFSSPVLIDVSGNGFSLTNAADGVDFDINGDGIRERLAWTAAASDDAWLVLDHSNNGRIDNGKELFGNYSPQTKPPFGIAANGFLALAEYDKTANGGNGDRVISQFDAVFSRLRLWRDENHNGDAEGRELHSLPELHVTTLELDYTESKRTDKYGNEFRYRAKVKNVQGQHMGRWAWDVYLKKSL
jgi:hypothetical protein